LPCGKKYGFYNAKKTFSLFLHFLQNVSVEWQRKQIKASRDKKAADEKKRKKVFEEENLCKTLLACFASRRSASLSPTRVTG
jgi:hypothetical protein